MFDLLLLTGVLTLARFKLFLNTHEICIKYKILSQISVPVKKWLNKCLFPQYDKMYRDKRSL